ncbi:uncharacterized protein [Halyomorpha halys]|uniref:uncharacterized protein n=1 Tax=Halyomorpha halys TaxID=286706 RepID=UPI000D0C8771|nr:uncharacterized protein LOC106683250 [Halyomorpha halys]
MNCLKLDLIGLVAAVSNKGNYQLLPGVFLSHNLSSISSPELLRAMNESNYSNHDLDSFLSSSVTNYLSSITLSVKVLDQSTIHQARSISDHILTNLGFQETGRRKGYGGAALWATGSMAAVGMAALAALSGKAMMTSMLALMMAGVSALKNGKSDSSGCHTAHVIDAIHGRAIELEKLTAPKTVEVSRADGVHQSALSNLKHPIPSYIMNR